MGLSILFFMLSINIATAKGVQPVDYLGEYSDGLYIAGTYDEQWKFGYVDEEFNWVIEPVYHGASVFIDGYADVWYINNTDSTENHGIIDTNGKMIIKPKYQHISALEKEYFIVQNAKENFQGGYGVVNLKGKEIISCDYMYIEALDTRNIVFRLVNEEFEEGFYDAVRDKMIAPEFAGIYEDNGYVHIFDMVDEQRKEGLYNNGNLVKPDYDYLEIYADHRTPKDVAFLIQGDTYRLMELEKGNMIMDDDTCSSILIFPNNAESFVATTENGTNFYNYDGEKLTDYSFDSLFTFTLAKDELTSSKNNKYGIMTTKGKEILPCIYDYITAKDKYGNYIVNYQGKYGLMGGDGNLILKPEYGYIEIVTSGEDYYYKTYQPSINLQPADLGIESKTLKVTEGVDTTQLVVAYDENSRLYGYKNKEGQWIIPPHYYIAEPFSEGLALVGYGKNQCGYINEKGQFVIEPKYHSMSGAFEGNRVITFERTSGHEKINSYMLLIDNKGQIIKKVEHDLITSSNTVPGVYGKIAGIIYDEKLEKYGYMTLEGEVVNPQLDVYRYKNGVGYFSNRYNDDVINFVNEEGKLEEIKGYVQYHKNNLIIVKDDNKITLLLSDGRIIKDYHGFDLVDYKEGSDGIMSVIYNRRSGNNSFYRRTAFINSEGQWLDLPAMVFGETHFSSGRATLSTTGSTLVIDTTGQVISELGSFEASENNSYLSKEEWQVLMAEVNKITPKILKGIDSDKDKVEALVEYLHKHITYDYDHYELKYGFFNHSQTAYGALINKLSVCEGYAEALELMLTTVGIESQIITGELKDDGALHAWNIVKINGQYYHVDATHNMGPVKDNYMMKDRTWNSEDYPKCP